MKFLAHISEDGLREQSVKEHSEGTAQRAAAFAKRFNHEAWGRCEGMLHDIGKYTMDFDRRLHGENIRVDHATAGAKLCWSRGGLYAFLSYCIAGHHAGLPDTGTSADTGSKATLLGRMKKHICDYGAYSDEIEVPPLVPPELTIVGGPKNKSFTISFFIRMLFSCLVDADFLDTEFFMKDGAIERDAGESMAVLLEKLRVHIEPWLKNEDLNTVNGHRTEILKYCMYKGSLPRGFFRLTVPTGGGKTVASLAFALEHAVQNHMDRVIYVIPYTSIIEQNAEVFRDILGLENVLENHYNVDYESCEEFKTLQLASENFDKPVIVTTNVQFFESLFSNKTSKCRKLHNLANSVIIFDEAQMLPTEYLKPCVAAIEELATNYNSSVVLCTATQPALEGLFSTEAHFTELCPRMEEQFRFFKRVQFGNLGCVTEDMLTSRLMGEHQALCILNTKKLAQKLYTAIQGEGVYHLSTTMYPMHRKRVLRTIRRRLADGERCIVISTSLVEAGVDFDFETVYRQLAGIDSMIQAGGRCNREGERSLQDSWTYIFTLEDGGKVPGQQTQIATAKQMMQKYDDISSLEAIHGYFKRLYHYRNNDLDQKHILELFNPQELQFALVGRIFKLIETNTVTIFIDREDKAKQILEQIRIKGTTRQLMREAGQYCIQIYKNEFEKFYSANLVEEVDRNYEDGLWILRDIDKYSDEVGLTLDVDIGDAVFC